MLLNGGQGNRRAIQRTSRLIGQPVKPLLLEAAHPLVAGLPADPKAPAKFIKRHGFLCGEFDKIVTKLHGVSRVPGHVESWQLNCQEVSTMSPHDCQLCPRSKQNAKRNEAKKRVLNRQYLSVVVAPFQVFGPNVARPHASTRSRTPSSSSSGAHTLRLPRPNAAMLQCRRLLT